MCQVGTTSHISDNAGPKTKENVAFSQGIFEDTFVHGIIFLDIVHDLLGRSGAFRTEPLVLAHLHQEVYHVLGVPVGGEEIVCVTGQLHENLLHK